MKQMEVQKIPYGEMFRVFGDTFVALDHVDGGGVLAIRRNIWKSAPFNKDGKNNLKGSSIHKELCEYLSILMKNGANADGVIKTTVDLKATDGTREYGFVRMWVGLLTLEQYGKYQHIIPDVEEGRLLATPWRTPGEKCGGYSSTWLVGSNGNVVCVCCFDAYGIRPALVFAPSLLVVKHEDSGEKLDGTEEEALYEKYINYISGWVNNRNEFCNATGESPMNYETWKAWDAGDE